MKFGITLPTAHEGHYLPSPFASPQDMVALVQKAESLGFYSAWGLDLTTPGASRGIVGKSLPNWYEMLMTVSYLFARTKRIRLGPMSLTLPYRDPIVLATQVSTIDAFSGGRLLLGLGVGFRDEYEAIRPRERQAHRGERLEEGIEALTALLTQKRANFKGRYYELQDIAMEPKPVHTPFPIYLAGKTPATYRRLARWATGWVLSRAQVMPPLKERIAEVKGYFDRVGRDVSQLDILATRGLSIANSFERAMKQFEESMLPSRMDMLARQENIGGNPSRDRVLQQNLVGTPDSISEQIQEMKESGVTHCVAFYPTSPTFERMMEEVQMLGEEVLPRFRN